MLVTHIGKVVAVDMIGDRLDGLSMSVSNQSCYGFLVAINMHFLFSCSVAVVAIGSCQKWIRIIEAITVIMPDALMIHPAYRRQHVHKEHTSIDYLAISFTSFS